eukprot:COSAG04_NODE_1213_length_7716_cov_4.100565_7_plen_89_part_00
MPRALRCDCSLFDALVKLAVVSDACLFSSVRKCSPPSSCSAATPSASINRRLTASCGLLVAATLRAVLSSLLRFKAADSKLRLSVCCR